jgi:hypothetical protein
MPFSYSSQSQAIAHFSACINPINTSLSLQLGSIGSRRTALKNHTQAIVLPATNKGAAAPWPAVVLLRVMP